MDDILRRCCLLEDESQFQSSSDSSMHIAQFRYRRALFSCIRYAPLFQILKKLFQKLNYERKSSEILKLYGTDARYCLLIENPKLPSYLAIEMSSYLILKVRRDRQTTWDESIQVLFENSQEWIEDFKKLPNKARLFDWANYLRLIGGDIGMITNIQGILNDLIYKCEAQLAPSRKTAKNLVRTSRYMNFTRIAELCEKWYIDYMLTIDDAEMGCQWRIGSPYEVKQTILDCLQANPIDWFIEYFNRAPDDAPMQSEEDKDSFEKVKCMQQLDRCLFPIDHMSPGITEVTSINPKCWPLVRKELARMRMNSPCVGTMIDWPSVELDCPTTKARWNVKRANISVTIAII